MKLKKLTYALSLAAVLGLSSCGSDFLNTPTDSRVELDTTEKLRLLLVSSYPNSNYGWPCELMSDNMEDNNARDENGMRYNLAPYDRGDEEMFKWEVCVTNTSNDSPSDIWQSHYGAIAGANAVLEVIEKWEKDGVKLDATQQAVKGEALLIRSYCHFILAQCFCLPYLGEVASEDKIGIPYITWPETTVKPHYQRGTLKETYDMIRKDLEEGLPLISDNIYEVPKYHFNKAAACAYAARFYLFTRDYENCLKYCNEAFGGPDVDPTQYCSTLYKNCENFYYLSDFGKYQQGADKPWNFLLLATYSQSFRHFYGGLRFACTHDAINATLHSSSPAWSDFKFSQKNGKTTKSWVMHPCFAWGSMSNGKMEYGSVYVGNICEQFEYTNKLAGIGYTHVTRSEFTGEEVLLTRAEAKLFLGDIDGALKDVSTWEKARRECPAAVGYEDRFVDLTIDNITKFYVTRPPKYGIAKQINLAKICPSKYDNNVSTDQQIAMLQCIQHFRRIDQIHTGKRWFDVKRYGIEYDRATGKDGFDHLSILDDRKAMQIPPEVQAAGMQANPRLNPEDTRVLRGSDFVIVSE